MYKHLNKHYPFWTIYPSIFVGLQFDQMTFDHKTWNLEKLPQHNPSPNQSFNIGIRNSGWQSGNREQLLQVHWPGAGAGAGQRSWFNQWQLKMQSCGQSTSGPQNPHWGSVGRGCTRQQNRHVHCSLPWTPPWCLWRWVAIPSECIQIELELNNTLNILVCNVLC